jgi:MarR family transcriptional regulator, 2-MHQ and catechol-resistance regulon repressor
MHGNVMQRALGTFVKLTRAVETITSTSHRHLAERDLTISQFGVLEALYHLGCLNQREIGRKVLKSNGNITVVLVNLERRELIRRTRLPQDRRHVKVELTDSGRELIAEIFPRHAKALVEAFSVLTPGEQEELSRLCRKLGLENQRDAQKLQVD